MFCYVIIEMSNGSVAGVWTYLRAEEAWLQYRSLKTSGALNLMIVKTVIGALMIPTPAQFETEIDLARAVARTHEDTKAPGNG